MSDALPLDLTTWLQAIADHQTGAREYLIEQGYHPNVIYAKAEKSARRGYTEYGVVADRPWLTDKGMVWLIGHGGTYVEPPPFTMADLYIDIARLRRALDGSA